MTPDKRQKFIAQATESFAKHAFITFAESISNVDDATRYALNIVRTERLQSIEHVKRELGRLVGLCDIAFRSTRIKQEADEAVEKFMAIIKLQYALYFGFSTIKLFHAKDNTPAVKSVSDTIGRIRGLLRADNTSLSNEDRQKVFKYIMKRECEIRGFEAARKSLSTKVQLHISERLKRGVCWLTINSLDQDVLFKIIEFVGFRSASSFMRTCKEAMNTQELKKLLPHLSVRHVIGQFPHVVNPGIDGSNCNFVVRKTLVHVFVDLAITGTKRTDPESVRLQKTAQHRAVQGHVHVDREPSRREIDKDNTQKSKRACKEQEVDDSRYRRRLAHEMFFSTPIKCSFQLVNADDNTPINEDGCMPLLSMPKWMRKPDAPDTTYTSRDGVPYPAHAAFNIEHLSNNHKDRKFKIKVVGLADTIMATSSMSHSCYVQTLVAYSEPFEIVSQKSVSFNVRARAEGQSSRKNGKLGNGKTN